MSNHIRPLDYATSSTRPRPSFAYVVFLLSNPSYLPGILVLAHSLTKYKSSYPLIVAINPALPIETQEALEEYGLEVRVVKPLKPSGEMTLIAERFVDTWTKVAVFDFVEYDVGGLFPGTIP